MITAPARGRLVAVVVSLALAACAHTPASSTALLDRAVSEADGAQATPRTIALAGYHALLVEANEPHAAQRFTAALTRDPGEPYALFGQLLLARRQGHPELGLARALDLCERAPKHALAAAAARYILDLSGNAIPLDDQILARAPKAIAAGLTGDAAHLLRSATGSILGARGDTANQLQVLQDMGVPNAFTLLGPLSPHHILGFDAPLPSEKDGNLPASLDGPFGTVKPRRLDAAEGRILLSGESADGDGYVVAVDVDGPAQAATYVVRTVTSASYRLYLDGTLLYEARAFERSQPTVGARAVSLTPGKHRMLLRLVKEDRPASVTLSLLRSDGQPSRLTFTPAAGPAPTWKGAQTVELAGSFPTAASFSDALTPEVGDLVAEYLAIRDGMGRDRDGAKRLMAHLSTVAKGPAITSLRADVALGDRTVPSKVARGRATRDLEATSDKDPRDVSALLLRATAALDDSRSVDAADLIKQARAAFTPVGYPVAMLEARIQLALQIDAQAEQSALDALNLQPGLCEALNLRYDLARRRDAVALADQLVTELAPCPGNLSRSAEHARVRGDLARATALYSKLLERDPTQVGTALVLANLHVSQREYGKAEALLAQLQQLWPRNTPLLKRRADVAELGGRPVDALALREQALRIDGADLPLRRVVERAKTGKEVLADRAIDGKKAIAAYEEARGSEDSAATYVLDAAAIRAYADGSQVDRIHVIQKALDQAGVQEIAEVNVPPGAQVLALRTIKPDGTVLEPESIEGKETVSLPGVQVGDYVEQEFLLAHPSRGPAQPGFTASSFYYQIARFPNNWSTYTVLAPKGTGMAVDAHNVTAEVPRTIGDEEVFFHEERRVPPFIPEPDAPPQATEFLPFVSVGAGTTGNEGVVAAYADAYLDRGVVTQEVEAFAREAVNGKTGREAVRALHSAVMQKLSGRDGGLTQSASASLAQDRGSRLWALKASLEAVGIRTRLAAIRAFNVDPAPYKFPNEALLPYVCLRAETPEGPVWLDTAIRFGPFGELPEQAYGNLEAFLLPEPGRPLEKLKSPAVIEKPGKEIRLTVALSADGKLSGEGEERYQGMEAAQLAEALDSLSPEQRNQALQSALSRYFGGAELSSVKLELKREVGVPLTVKYAFVAPRFGRVEGDSLVLGPLTFPARLGKRFVQVGSRRTPLMIDDSERTRTVVQMTLPPGYEVSGPVPQIASKSPWGKFVRTEKQEKGVFHAEESYELGLSRIPPKAYEDFASFAGEVDLIQSRDLLVVKKK